GGRRLGGPAPPAGPGAGGSRARRGRPAPLARGLAGRRRRRQRMTADTGYLHLNDAGSWPNLEADAVLADPADGTLPPAGPRGTPRRPRPRRAPGCALAAAAPEPPAGPRRRGVAGGRPAEGHLQSSSRAAGTAPAPLVPGVADPFPEAGGWKAAPPDQVDFLVL